MAATGAAAAAQPAASGAGGAAASTVEKTQHWAADDAAAAEAVAEAAGHAGDDGGTIAATGADAQSQDVNDALAAELAAAAAEDEDIVAVEAMRRQWRRRRWQHDSNDQLERSDTTTELEGSEDTATDIEDSLSPQAPPAATGAGWPEESGGEDAQRTKRRRQFEPRTA